MCKKRILIKKLKTPEYAQNKIARTFYNNQDYYSKEKDRVQNLRIFLS